MGIKIEVSEGKYVEIPNTLARSILEQVLSLGDDYHVDDVDDIVATVGDIIDDLHRGINYAAT